MKTRIEQIKNIRSQYGFPVWLIKEALKYYNNDEDKAIERLIEIYNAIGDHPNVVIKRNIEKFKKEIEDMLKNIDETLHRESLD